MVFNSIYFLFVFLPITLILYYVVPARLKNVLLVIISFIFYAWGSPKSVIFLLFAALFNYASGIEIEHLKISKHTDMALKVLIASAAANVVLLASFKYIFDDMPVGMSFFTFTVLSYLFDVYAERAGAQRNPVNFILYVSFFPKLLSGPIVQYANMESQLTGRKADADKLMDGGVLFLIGLGKKVLLADALGAGFALLSQAENSILGAWLMMIFYSLQLYFDFSGYSDMAIGLSKMFGFEFEKNFDYPYMSLTIAEFWRRWHISLGNWFKQYVYFPMGGSRVPDILILRNLLVVWLLTGIWHGNTFCFVVWGLYHGAFVILERFVIKGRFDGFPAALRRLATCLIAGIGWIFFFSPTLPSAFRVILSMMGGATFATRTAVYVLRTYFILLVVSFIGCTPFGSFLWNRLFTENNIGLNEHILTFIAVALRLGLLVLCTASLLGSTYTSFLYFAF